MWPQPCQGSCLGYRLIASSSGHIIFSRKKVGKKIEISSRNGKTFEDPTDRDLGWIFYFPTDICLNVRSWRWMWQLLFDSTNNSSPLQILGFRQYQYFRNSVFLVGFSAKSATEWHIITHSLTHSMHDDTQLSIPYHAHLIVHPSVSRTPLPAGLHQVNM